MTNNHYFSGRLRVTLRLLICFSLMSVLPSSVMAQETKTSKKSQNLGKSAGSSANASGPQWMKSSHRGWVAVPNGAKPPATVRLASMKTQEEPSNTPASAPPPVPTQEPVNESTAAATTPVPQPAQAEPTATTSATDAKGSPASEGSSVSAASEQEASQKSTSPDASSAGTKPPLNSIKEQLKASFLNRPDETAPNAVGLSVVDEDVNSDDPLIRERAKQLKMLQERLRIIMEKQRRAKQAQPPVAPSPGPQPEPQPHVPDPHSTPQPDPHPPVIGPKPEPHPVAPDQHPVPHPEPHPPVPGPKPEPHPPGPDVPPQPHPESHPERHPATPDQEPHPPGPNSHPEAQPAETTTIEGTIDHLGLANNLFALGHFDVALDVYQQADMSTLSPQQQFWVEYQQASCLRRLGRSAEASNRYRRLADKPEAGSLSELSQWWVTTLEKKRQLEKKIGTHPQNATSAEHVPSDLHTPDPHGVAAPLKSTPEAHSDSHSDPHEATPNVRTGSGHATDHSDHKEDTHGGPKH